MESDLNRNVLDGYDVVGVREGSMSTVYLCRTGIWQREMVAIKEPKRTLLEDPLVRTLFVRECHAWARLGEHPNIVRVIALHLMAGTRPQLVLEHVAHTLEEHLARRTPGPAELLRIAIQVCDAMIHCARVVPGMVHQDLKPSNLMVTEDGVVKVTDWGLVRIAGARTLSGPRGAGAARVAFAGDRDDREDAGAVGTAGYQAPEQVRGDLELDSRADVYALGVLLFELSSRRLPFRVTVPRDAETAHVLAAPRPLRGPLAELGLEALVARCLANEPARRPSFPQLRARLAAALEDRCGETCAAPVGRAVGMDPNILAALIKLGDADGVARICDRAEADGTAEAEWLHHFRGKVALARGDPETAVAMFERALEAAAPPKSEGRADLRAAPSSVAHRQPLAMALAGLGRLDEAIEHQRAIVEAQPKMAAGWHNLGLYLRDAGRRGEARTALERARGLAADPVHFAALANLLAVGERDFASARAELATGLRLDAEAPDLHAEMARTLVLEAVERILERGERVDESILAQLEKAQSHFERARRLGGAEREADAPFAELGRVLAEPWVRLGIRLREEGDHDAARRFFDAAIAADPEGFEPHVQRGILHLGRGELEDALESFEAALDRHPGEPLAWANKAAALNALGRAEEALECASEAVRVDPEQVNGWINRGSALLRLERVEAALSNHREALSRGLEHPSLHHGIGVALGRSGRHEEALEAFDHALALDSGHLSSLCDKGLAAMQLGRFDDAAACFDRVLEIDEGDARAWMGRGAVLANGYGLYPQALACFEHAEALGHPQAGAAVAQLRGALSG